MFYVYEWYIVDTGEVIYVGKGFRNRYKCRKHNRIFAEFLKRYNCESRIVKYFEKEEDAFLYEAEHMAELKEKGLCVCNIQKGGYGGENKSWTEEKRREYSEHNIMKSDMQRKRMSENNPMKNKDTAQKVADSICRKVCIGQTTYSSGLEVAEAYNVTPQAIIYWLKRGYAPNHEACYYYGDSIPKVKVKDRKCSKVKKLVLIDGVKYESVKAASRVIGGSSSSLSRALIEGRTFKGHDCRYCKD